MGIRLDWEIEAEREQTQHSAGEDPETRRRRRRARTRFLLVLFFLLALVGAAVGAVVLRLRQVDWQTEQLLRDSVVAEVTTLRLGDREAFLKMQRSATDEWIQSQDATFARYQALKQSENVSLTGRVIDAKIDGARARVQVEEIIDGIPYGRLWFYWRYEDGWRHVPPDYTFWGDAQTLSADGVTVQYHDVDAVDAQPTATRLSDWLKIGCAALGCATPPHLTVEIVPSTTLQTGWSPSDQWTLQMPSPFVTGARLDMPFDSAAQLKVAELLAERLVGDFSPLYPADAYYLRQAIVSWLVERFAQIETNSFLISSLAERYGDVGVGRLLQSLQSDSGVGVLASVTGTTLDGAGLDWRDFLTWRVTLENEGDHARGAGELSGAVRSGAERAGGVALRRRSQRETRTVVSAVSEQGDGGIPQLRAVVKADSGEQEVVFKLIDNDWKRAS
ncbi:MAG: hypothetical protein U0521_01345 [Anaerolineae bacterium]